MDIYAEAGDKVVYLGENGQDYQRERVESQGIRAGDVLTVVYCDVDSWSTAVEFEEIKGCHNSVMFEDAP